MNLAQMLGVTVTPLHVEKPKRQYHADLKQRTIEIWKNALKDGPLSTGELAAKMGYSSISHTMKKMKARGHIKCIGEVKIAKTKTKVWRWNNEPTSNSSGH